MVMFGILFSNMPFYVLTGALDAYMETRNIVDEAWRLSQNENVVDKFTSYRNLTEQVKIREAQAAIIAQYTGGLLVYADDTVGTPKYKVFDDTTGFGAEQSASSVGASAINWIRVAASPTNDEWIIATRDAANVIKAQVCTGVDGGVSCGTPTTITATAGTHGFRNYDVAYERTSGDALLVYGTATADELRKIVWTGGAWGSDAAITTTRTTGTVEWVELTSRNGSDQIGIAYSDTNDDVSAYRWSGTAVADEATAAITATAVTGDVRKFDVSFEGTSGDMLVVSWVAGAGTAATGQLVGTTWTIGTQTAVDMITGFVDLQEPNPSDDDLAVFSHGTAAASNPGEGFEWGGTGVVDGTAGDDIVQNWAANYQLGATAYVSTTYYAATVHSSSATADDIDWWTMNSAGTITNQSVNARTRGASRFIDLFDYPSLDKVLLLTSDANSDLWADTWDGTTPSATVWVDRTSGGALETALSIGTKDVVDFAFRLSPPPNTAPTLTVTQPDGTGDTVTVGDLYNITYDLADPEETVTVAMYYDTDATGLNGTAITGACAAAPEGTGATCSWDTTGMTPGTYYVYGLTSDGVNPQVSDYSPGVITINGPLTVTISQTAGSKVSTKGSGDVNQYAHDTACTGAASCAAFALTASNGTVNVTSIKVTESGTVTANTELSDVNLYYDTDGNWSDAGAETLFGTAATLAADQTATISGTLAITSGQTAYIYVRYDLGNGTTYPMGGATVNWQIAAATDVVSDGTESGSGTLAGTQTVLPTADSVTYAVSPDGGRSGNTATISGKGFGAPSLDADQQDCATATVGSKGCVRFIVGGNATVSGTDISTWNNTTITFTINSGIATLGGASALEVVAAAQGTATDLTYYIYPTITGIIDDFSYAGDTAREYSAGDNAANNTTTDLKDGEIQIDGDHFGTSGTVTIHGVTATQAVVGTRCGGSAYTTTCITVQVPTGISDSSYTGNLVVQRVAGVTDTLPGFRVLPRVTSMTPALKGGRGDTGFSLSGDHLCQSGTCPTAFSAADSANFNGGSVTSGASAWTDTSVPSITIPAAAVDGNVNITSNTTYTSNSLTFDVKFAPTTPANSSPTNGATGQSKNPTLTAGAFSDGTDGDTHSDSMWQITNLSGNYGAGNKVWEDALSSAQVTIAVNNTNGTFTNTTISTELNCGTTYYWHVRYKDNSAVTSQEWSAYSGEYSFTTVSCNVAPTLTVTQPDGTGDTVTVGDLYNITYDLADPEETVTVAMYYDTDATGLNGTAITGACAAAPEGTGATCSWDTTGMTPGTYYVYGLTSDGVNPQVSDYSPGVITINGPLTVTISQTAGSKVSTKGSGDVNQYAHDTACTGAASCAAFALTASNGTVNVTSIKVTESGTVTANTELSDVNLYYDTDGNWSDAGAETLFGTAATLAADQTATISGTLAITSGQTAYIYVRYDLGNGTTYPMGGATVNWQIAAATDVVSDGTESGSGTLAGTQTVLPTADSVTYAVSPDGGRSGNTATISGKGFGAPSLDADQQDCATATVGSKGCVRFIVGGNATVSGTDISTWNNTTITFTINSGIATLGGASALEVVAAAQGTATDLTYYIYPTITGIIDDFSYAGDTAREYSAGDNAANNTTTDLKDGEIQIDGDHFGTSGTVTIHGVTATQAVVGTRCGGSAYTTTCITVQVPTGISDSSYTGNLVVQRVAGVTDTLPGFRVLPRVTSLSSANGVLGDPITVIGNHLCQSGTCPGAFSYISPIDNILFGATNATGPTVWSWGHGNSSTAGVDVKVPSGSGTVAVKVVSNDYESDTTNFTYLSTVPNAPTTLQQFKSDGVTEISVEGGSNSSPVNVIMEGDFTADTSITAFLEVEVKSVNTAFDGTVTASSTEATGSSFTNKSVSVQNLTDGNYHWRIRSKNKNTSETSAWVAFGSNPSGDGSTDGSPANTDFYLDTAAPTISGPCAVSPTATSCDSSLPTDIQAKVIWTTNENATRQVAYGTSCGTGGTASAVFTSMTNKEPSSPSGVSGSPHTVTLSGLQASQTYYYKIRASDTLGNVSYNPSDTTCLSFSTSAPQTRVMKTLEYFIDQNTATGGTLDKTYDIYISESKSDRSNIKIQSATIEVFGTSVGGSGNITVNTKLNSEVTGLTYTLADPGAGKSISWKISRFAPTDSADSKSIKFDCVYCTDNASTNNRLEVTVGPSTTSLLSAKLILTYYYEPL